MNFGGGIVRLCAGPQKSYDEPIRNRKLAAAARTLQAALNDDEPDRKKEVWTLVCWRSGTVVVSRRRTCTLSQIGDITWAPGWHYTDTFGEAETTLGERGSRDDTHRVKASPLRRGARRSNAKRTRFMDMERTTKIRSSF